MKPASLALFVGCILALVPTAAAAAGMQVVQRIPLHDGAWDILTVDPASHRMLISRSDGVDAVDTRTSAATPRLINGSRFHGVTVVPGTPLAVATEAAGAAVVFNALTGKV